MWQRLKVGLTNRSYHNELYYDDEAFGIMQGILRRFRDFCQEHGARGFVIVFPTKREAEFFKEHRIVNYQPLHDFLASESIPYLDMIETFAEEDDVPSLFINRNAHLTARASEIVAEKLYRFLKSHNAIPRPRDEPANGDGDGG